MAIRVTGSFYTRYILPRAQAGHDSPVALRAAPSAKTCATTRPPPWP